MQNTSLSLVKRQPQIQTDDTNANDDYDNDNSKSNNPNAPLLASHHRDFDDHVANQQTLDSDIEESVSDEAENLVIMNDDNNNKNEEAVRIQTQKKKERERLEKQKQKQKKQKQQRQIQNNHNHNEDDNDTLSITPLPDESGAIRFKWWSKERLRQGCLATLFVLVLFLSIQIFFMPGLLHHLFKEHVKEAFIFTSPQPGNTNYDMWVSNTVDHGTPIQFSLQFYNVTNPDEVLLGAYPKLNLTPPVTYYEYYTRRDVNFSEDGEWVSYDLYEYYLYHDGMKENEVYTIISPLVGTVWHLYNTSNKLEQKLFRALLNELNRYDPQEVLFWTGTVYDLIWSMYNFSFTYKGETIQVSWGLLFNESHQLYTTHTGHNDPSRMSEIKEFGKNFSSSSTLAKSEYCTCWAPPMSWAPSRLYYFGVDALDDKDDIPPLFLDVLYRGLELEYTGKDSYRNIPLYQYKFSISPQLDNATVYPPNSQFNQFGPGGVLNLTSCYSDIPIFATFSNFYGAPYYANMNPNFGIPLPPQEDPSYISVEPNTGVIFKANAGMQLVLPVHPLPVDTTYRNTNGSLAKLRDLMVPTYVITFGVDVDHYTADSYAETLNLVDGAKQASYILGYICIPICVLWIWYYAYKFGRRHSNIKN